MVGKTHRGRVRPTNEDAFYAALAGDDDGACLCLVADGMGGSNAGEVASEMAVTIIAEQAQAWLADAGSCPQHRRREASEALAQAVLAANDRVYQAGRDDPSKAGMGTTVTAALIADGVMSLVHVGDSRALLIRAGAARRLTSDHSLVAELMRNGALTEHEAASHPHRNILTRALGTDSRLALDIHEEALAVGDVVLLCSDGVTRHASDEDFVRLAGHGRSPGEIASQLIAYALQEGGLDNLTCVVVSCLGGAANSDR